MRELLLWAQYGATRTYFYQFADMPGDPVFGGLGMVDASGNAKPQYNAVKNFVALFADPGTAYSPP